MPKGLPLNTLTGSVWELVWTVICNCCRTSHPVAGRAISRISNAAPVPKTTAPGCPRRLSERIANLLVKTLHTHNAAERRRLRVAREGVREAAAWGGQRG